MPPAAVAAWASGTSRSFSEAGLDMGRNRHAKVANNAGVLWGQLTPCGRKPRPAPGSPAPGPAPGKPSEVRDGVSLAGRRRTAVRTQELRPKALSLQRHRARRAAAGLAGPRTGASVPCSPPQRARSRGVAGRVTDIFPHACAPRQPCAQGPWLRL